MLSESRSEFQCEYGQTRRPGHVCAFPWTCPFTCSYLSNHGFLHLLLHPEIGVFSAVILLLLSSF